MAMQTWLVLVTTGEYYKASGASKLERVKVKANNAFHARSLASKQYPDCHIDYVGLSPDGENTESATAEQSAEPQGAEPRYDTLTDAQHDAWIELQEVARTVAAFDAASAHYQQWVTFSRVNYVFCRERDTRDGKAYKNVVTSAYAVVGALYGDHMPDEAMEVLTALHHFIAGGDIPTPSWNARAVAGQE